MTPKTNEKLGTCESTAVRGHGASRHSQTRSCRNFKPTEPAEPSVSLEEMKAAIEAHYAKRHAKIASWGDEKSIRAIYAKLPKPDPAQGEADDDPYHCSFTASGEHQPDVTGQDCVYCGARGREHKLRSAKPSPAPQEPAMEERPELAERLAIAFAAELLPKCPLFMEPMGVGAKCYPPPSEEGTSPTRNVHALWRAALKVMDALETELTALRAKTL